MVVARNLRRDQAGALNAHELLVDSLQFEEVSPGFGFMVKVRAWLEPLEKISKSVRVLVIDQDGELIDEYRPLISEAFDHKPPLPAEGDPLPVPVMLQAVFSFKPKRKGDFLIQLSGEGIGPLVPHWVLRVV